MFLERCHRYSNKRLRFLLLSGILGVLETRSPNGDTVRWDGVARERETLESNHERVDGSADANESERRRQTKRGRRSHCAAGGSRRKLIHGTSAIVLPSRSSANTRH